MNFRDDLEIRRQPAYGNKEPFAACLSKLDVQRFKSSLDPTMTFSHTNSQIPPPLRRQPLTHSRSLLYPCPTNTSLLPQKLPLLHHPTRGNSHHKRHHQPAAQHIQHHIVQLARLHSLHEDLVRSHCRIVVTNATAADAMLVRSRLANGWVVQGLVLVDLKYIDDDRDCNNG